MSITPMGWGVGGGGGKGKGIGDTAVPETLVLTDFFFLVDADSCACQKCRDLEKYCRGDPPGWPCVSDASGHRSSPWVVY
jgi:hypothetical protein